MTQNNEVKRAASEKRRSAVDAEAAFSAARWLRLCETYLPVKSANTIWRFSRATEPEEPSQGWKLHVSATILEACDLFEKVAAFLTSRGAQFKAPVSLEELYKINCGLQYGYEQVGKFITVYPATEREAVRLARALHELTGEFTPVAVPFDERFAPQSSVFYRFGAFTEIEATDENGEKFSAVVNPSGELVRDDRFKAVPDWRADPFRQGVKNPAPDSETADRAPLVTTYKIFAAITQRGKGGTYHALDFSQNPPRLCVVKEGRRYGEIYWNRQDGYALVANECRVLKNLGEIYPGVPRVYSSFEADGNFYLAMEYVEGVSLYDLLKFRRRRFSIKRTVDLAIEIAGIIAEIHRAGWIWNDCKPANLIVTGDRTLRPIDFENAHRFDCSAPFNWKTEGFAASSKNPSSARAADLYALGAVVYFLLTGRLYNAKSPVAIAELRRKVPPTLRATIETLLDDPDSTTAVEIGARFKQISNDLRPPFINSRIF